MVKNFIAFLLIGMSLALCTTKSLSEETEETIDPSGFFKTDTKSAKEDCGFYMVKTEQGCMERRTFIIEQPHDCTSGRSPFSGNYKTRVGNWERKPPEDPTDPNSPIRLIHHVCL